MCYTVYVLYSPSGGKTYVGYTSNLERRLREHNETESKGYTLRYRPWILLYTETYAAKSAAMGREKYFKTGVGREALKEILSVRYPPSAEKD